METLKQCAQLAGWPEDPKDFGRQRLLALWNFSTQPFDFERLRAAAFKEMKGLLSTDEAGTWEEAEWRDVVGSLGRGSAEERVLVADAVRKMFHTRPKECDRLMVVLYTAQMDSRRSSVPDPDFMNDEPSVSGAQGNVKNKSGKPNDSQPRKQGRREQSFEQESTEEEQSTQERRSTPNTVTVPRQEVIVKVEEVNLVSEDEECEGSETFSVAFACPSFVQNSPSSSSEMFAVAETSSGQNGKKAIVAVRGKSPISGTKQAFATLESPTPTPIVANKNGPTLEISKAPAVASLVQTPNLANEKTPPVSAVSSGKSLIDAVVGASAVGNVQTATVAIRKEPTTVNGKTPTVSCGKSPAVEIGESAPAPAPPSVTLKSQTGTSGKQNSSVSEPAPVLLVADSTVYEKRPNHPSDADDRSLGSTDTPAVNDSSNSSRQTKPSKEAVTDQAFETTSRPAENILVRGKRKGEEESAMEAKRKQTAGTALTSQSSSSVMKLTVSDIASPEKMQDGCALIDILKWEEILERCCASANDKSCIRLPEGTFSFPFGYCLTANSPRITISGNKGMGPTTLCFFPEASLNSTNNPEAGNQEKTIALRIGSTITLGNLSLKRASLNQSLPFWWPVVTLEANNCGFKNITFFGCGLEIESAGNVVEKCQFYGGTSPVDQDPDVATTRSKSICKAINLEYSRGGNVIKDISIQDVYCGVSRHFSEAMRDKVSNITCNNVRFGVTLNNCVGETVQNVTYGWNLNNKRDPESNQEVPTAVEIRGGEGNLVDGIICGGRGNNFYAVTLRRSSEQVPRRNTIRMKIAKRAQSRYVDEGEGNLISNVVD